VFNLISFHVVLLLLYKLDDDFHVRKSLSLAHIWSHITHKTRSCRISYRFVLIISLHLNLRFPRPLSHLWARGSILIPLASSLPNLYDIYLLLCIQCYTPDDGQRNCPKRVEFYSKNKFEKLIHLVGFIIRIILIVCYTVHVYSRMRVWAES
jgi:hypothetical protein